MATSPSERMKAYRARKRSRGLKRLSVFLTEDAQDALENLRAKNPDLTTDAVISALLLGQFASPGYRKPVTGLQHEASPGYEKTVTGLQPIPSPGYSPNSRAALAAIGHQWKKEGLSVVAVAERFNAQGWTPDQIPKAEGEKPRADSAKAWTLKAISQLLNRDHPVG